MPQNVPVTTGLILLWAVAVIAAAFVEAMRRGGKACMAG